ncbi:hypothetical protein [Saccharothrix sp.]
MKPLVVLNVAGMTPALLPHMPNLSAPGDRGGGPGWAPYCPP